MRKRLIMPRQSRLDAHGTLNRVIRRGFEGTKIFRNEGDKRDFVSRLAELCQAGFWRVYEWARCLFCQVAVGRMSYPAAETALFLGVTTSAVVRAAHTESHPEIEKYLSEVGTEVGTGHLRSHNDLFLLNLNFNSCQAERDRIERAETASHTSLGS